MGLSIKGYVLEPPRVGAANSPYTYTPNDFISNQGNFDAAYPPDESAPRSDYFVLVLQDGLLFDAKFGWTKNQVIQRFDYDVLDQRFKTLAGAPVTNAGILTVDANTTRLKVTAPIQVWAAAPYRLVVGPLPGTAFIVDLVTAFGSPAVGHVEILTTDGTLNWNPLDLVAPNLGQPVWFQRQQFFTAKESNGNIGLIDDALYLNPLPATGQFPLLRIGFGLWLEPIESGAPLSGQVRWDPATGLLTFNAADVTANTGKPVYYDGVLLGYNLSLPTIALTPGTMPGSGSLTMASLPAEGGELVFRVLPPGPLAVTVQFPITTRLDSTATLDPAGKAGYVQVKPSGGGGLVQFSATDAGLYQNMTVEVVSGDLLIEPGITMRFFRCSANLDASDSQIPDVRAFYEVKDAVLADPMIGSPLVSLPAVPIDGNPAYPFTVKVTQGTGSFLADPLPRLDGATEVVTPGVTTGFTLNLDGRQLQYAQRKNWDGSTVTDLPLEVPSGAANLPDTLLSPSFTHLSLDTGAGFVPLNVGTDALVDLLGGVVSFVTTAGTQVPTFGGGHATFSGTTLTDAPGAFAGVLPGDLVILPSEAAEAVYTVTAVQHGVDTITTDVAWSGATPLTDIAYEIRRSREVLADRFWSEAEPVDPNTKVERVLSLGVIPSVLPRLTIKTPFRNQQNVFFADTVTVTTVPNDSKFSPTPLPSNQVEISLSTGNMNLTRAELASPRFRFGPTTFSTSVVMVKDDASFTSPATHEVEISLATGSCNFSPADFGVVAYWVRKLRRKVDYRMIAHLGFIEFTQRMMMGEEALITYAPLVDGVAEPVVEEPSTWIIRKETTPPRTVVVNTVSFNTAGRRVATNPAPSVFRGGRPQDSTQISMNTTNSTVTFLPDRILTNVLPHGPNVGTSENIYVDYFVYDAVGGEKTTTVLQPPLALATADIAEGSESFVIKGDQTTVFPAGYLLRVEQDDVYLIGTSVYASAEDETTVTLAYGAIFRNGLNDPKLYVASGPTPRTFTLWQPAYFGTEIAAYDTVARGMNQLAVVGDRTSVYRVGTVVAFTNGAGDFFDTLLISGAAYDAETDRTKITFTQNALRQYTSGAGGAILRYTVRPLLDDQTKKAQTSRTPVLTEPYTMYRRQAGLAGRLLQIPSDYEIDDSGSVKFTSPLLAGEELVLLYTGHRIVPAGSKLRYSYTSTIVPTDSNGMTNQILAMDYWLYAPDTFYFRVEKLSIFQAEVAKQFQQEAVSSSPSGGPNTSNASQPKLYEQGRESLFFPEGHLANADIVVRAFLKFFNDAVNYLEDVLQDIDGRVVGDADGRLKFDGKVDNPTRLVLADVTNQIDDILKVSDFPIKITHIFPPPPTFVSIGTYQKIYLPGRWSRFFPTFRAALSAGPTNGLADMGAEIADLKWPNLTGTDSVAFRRGPRGSIVKDVPAGDTLIYLDNATGSDDPVLRPPFGVGNVVVIRSPTATYVAEAFAVTVVGVAGSPERIQVSDPLPYIPAGATVYLCQSGTLADPALKNYRVPMDVGVNYAGKFTYVKAYFPFDGSVPLIPTELCVQEVNADEYLQVNNVTCDNALLAPFRFPALDGKPIMDCGDQAVPLISPSPVRELAYTPMAIDGITDTIAATVATATISNGSLDGLLKTISIPVGPWPGPAAQQFDLVRITTGPNATAGWRRITSLGATSVEVDAAFPSPDPNPFDFIVTAGLNVLASTFFTGIGPGPTYTVVQVAGDVSATVKAGQTAIITNGTAAGTRRQIATVTVIAGPATQLTLDAPFTKGSSDHFRVSNHLSTFGPLTDLAANTLGLLSVLQTNDLPDIASEIKAIDRLFDGNVPAEDTTGIFTDILSPASDTGTVAGNVLTGSGAVDLSVANSSHYVFIRDAANPNMGLYPVQTATPTTININGTFPGPPGGMVSFRVVSVFGFSKSGLSDVMCVLKLTEADAASAVTFDTLVTTLLPVVALPADPLAFATGVTTDLLNARQVVLAARNTQGILDVLSGLMTSKEKLYDKRYIWVDARINRKTGLLAKQVASVAARQVATAEQQAALSKKAQIDLLLNPEVISLAELAAPPPPLCP